MLPNNFRIVKIQRELPFVTRARDGQGKGDYKNKEIPPKKSGEARKQAGKKKKGGLGEGIFARLLWKAVRLCVSKEAKLAKIASLIEKNFLCMPIKNNVSIFASFTCRR